MEDNQQSEFTEDVKNTDNENVEGLKQCERFPNENKVSTPENAQNELVTGLPPIDIHELAKVLRDPNMPSQKIMKEVADHMVMKICQKENSSDASDSAAEGMKSVMDCIIEVCLRHEDSDNSDEDDDYCEGDKTILREIPCKFCNKIFNSSMMCKTHILVAHPQQDPSVLNIKYLSENEVNKKNSSSRRRSSRCSSKTDCDLKSLQPLEALAHKESNPLSSRQHSNTMLQTLQPHLSESLRSAAESKVSQEESGQCMESTTHMKDAETIETCDINVSISSSLSEPGVCCETQRESSGQIETMQCAEQGDNNSKPSSGSPHASKHKLLESDTYADMSAKKSRAESSFDAPSS